MKPSKEQQSEYFDVLEMELRKMLQEIADGTTSTFSATAAELVAVGVAERMRGMPQPPIEDVRRHVGFLFDPEIFEDEGKADPLHALAARRKRVLG